MHIEELLAQVGAEHEALRSKYDEALVEISFLRTCLADTHVADHHLTVGPHESLQEDTELLAFQHKVVYEPLHSMLPPEKETSGGLSRSASDLESFEQKRNVFLEFNSRTSATTSWVDHSYNSLQGKAQTLLANPMVEFFLFVMILSNCFIMWIDTDQRASTSSVPSWLEASDTFYLGLYVAEFAFRLFAYRSRVFLDRWTRLDFFIIVIDTVSTIGKQVSGTNFFGGLNISLFRLFRVFRIARVFKILRYVGELQILIHGFYGAVRAVFWATIMLEIVVLLWCFVLVEIIHPLAIQVGCPQCTTAYSSMAQAHLSIIQTVIAGDSWGNVNLSIIEAHPGSSVVIFGCLVTIQFVMLNLIFTVIVDAAHRARDEDEQQKLAEKQHHFTKLKQKLLEICHELDADGNGELNLEELTQGYDHNPAFADVMASLDVGREDMTLLFVIMDEDHSGTVSAVEFVNNIYKLKEQDVHTTLMFIKGYLVDLRSKVNTTVLETITQNLSTVKATQKQIEVMMHDVGLLVSSSEIVKSADLHDANVFNVSEDLGMPTVRLPTSLPPPLMPS